MCAMSREHRIDPHLLTSSSGYAGHFLPVLPTQVSDRNLAELSETPILQRRKATASSGLSSSLAAMARAEECAKKIDRKALARRHLTAGLVSCQMGQIQGQNKSVRRAHSFNHTFRVSDHPATRVVSNRPDTGQLIPNGHSENNLSPLRRDCARRSLVAGDKNTRKVIQQWNELLLELNNEQNRHMYQQRDHYDVISNQCSFEEDNDDEVSSPSRTRQDKFAQIPQLVRKDDSKVSMKVSVFPTGIGISKYRPITPNFLVKLDKKKLPPRKRTQLWIDQIPIQKRHFYKVDKGVDKVEGGHRGECNNSSPDSSSDVQSGRLSKAILHDFL